MRWERNDEWRKSSTTNTMLNVTLFEATTIVIARRRTVGALFFNVTFFGIFSGPFFILFEIENDLDRCASVARELTGRPSEWWDCSGA